MRAAGMQRLERVSADLDALFVRKGCEGIRSVVVGPAGAIGTDDHSSCLPKAMRGIHDVLVELVGPGQATEDIVVSLPEARRLEGELHAVKIGGTAGDRGFLGR